MEKIKLNTIEEELKNLRLIYQKDELHALTVWSVSRIHHLDKPHVLVVS